MAGWLERLANPEICKYNGPSPQRKSQMLYVYLSDNSSSKIDCPVSLDSKVAFDRSGRAK